MGIEVEEVHPPVGWAAAIVSGYEQAREPVRERARDLPERAFVSGSRRELDREVAPQVVVELLQRLDHQVVEREPDRAAPVRVAAEQMGVRVARLVANLVLLAVEVESYGFGLVHL